MFARAKRPRGATVAPRRDVADRQLPLTPRRALALLIVAACFFAGMLLNSSDEPTLAAARASVTPAPPAVEPQESHDRDLWQITDDAYDSNHDPAAAMADTAAARQPQEQPWREEVVKRGDNLSLIFQRAGFSKRDVHEVVTGTEHGKTLARIFPGEVVAFQADPGGDLMTVRYVKSPLETVYYRRDGEGFTSEVETREPEVRESWATGEITSSLFMAGQDAGLSQTMIMELANIFGGVIDFVLDPRRGDTIHLIYEELYIDGEKYADGNIIAASFTNQGKTYNAYRYVDSNGDANFYNEDGVSMRKAFLLAPVDFTRISSNFNMKRLHPIYKTTRPHRGTDYAAPTGTPVYASGDGRVIKAGYTRANGNYVFIQHGDRYVTRYLHLHKRQVKQGQRVSQSQVIGTVGSTGAATGPHLHYEFLMDGVHRDPRKIHTQLPKARTLPAAEMLAFKQTINQSSMQLASLRADNQLAANSSAELEANTN